MYPWNCCRLCLAVQDLHLIFPKPEHSDKYTDVIFITSGIKVKRNDNLPQEMCTSCINFINNSYNFRKKCEETQNTLQTRLIRKDKFVYEVKIETNEPPQDNNHVTIEILDVDNDLASDNNFNNTAESNDAEHKTDDVEFDTSVEDIVEKPINNIFAEHKTDDVEFDTSVEDIVEKPINNIFTSKKRKNSSDKPVKKRVRTKKDNEVRKDSEKKNDCEEKKQRVKEEIECEYCHKILTSKLSVRNHYKIHTGFDVVCEHCGKKFITRRLLLMHCRAKHGYEKTDKCSYCDYRASNAEQVKIHERLHTGEKPYVCSQCGAGFHRKSSYLQHVAIHLPDKTVQCDECPARFKSVTLMRIHKNRHRAPQYRFKCRVCENSFARRRNVARHIAQIHGMAAGAAAPNIQRIKIIVNE